MTKRIVFKFAFGYHQCNEWQILSVLDFEQSSAKYSGKIEIRLQMIAMTLT